MSYTYTYLEEFTQKIYEDINIYKPNELNFYSIADSLNIGVYPISSSSQAIQSEGRQYIFLNNTLTASECFEVFGHELGHILMHAGNQQSMNEDYRIYQEWKANLFALHFCVPTFMLQSLDLPDDHSQSITLIKETFRVTYQFADKRLNMYKQRLQDVQLNRRLQNSLK